jgi:5-methylcytosine-specific restriction endonuclease McrA
MNTCLICKKNKFDTSGDVLLLNNLLVHKGCEQDLYLSIKDKTKDKKDAGNIELDNLKNLQKSIYDYWPSYPPDWNERKQMVREKRKVCSVCGKASTRKYRKCPLEFHHTIPISAGGNHLESNLELICKSCHKKEHEKNPYRFRKKR